MANIDNENPNSSLLSPPDCVKGMTKLDKSKFEKLVKVPFVVVNKKLMQTVSKILKPYYLLIPKYDCVRDENEESKLILLNPTLVSSFNDISEEKRTELKSCGITDLNFKEICLSFENFDRDEIFKAILPSGTAVASHSVVGHIVQLNLKDCLMPFKTVIGEVFLETSPPHIKRIITKVQKIASEFRNFEMEVLAEKDDAKDLGTIVEVKESNCVFKFDFANVYWNPRLETERRRVLNKIKRSDVLYDVFAGVGPFAIPVAKKVKSKVLANDLNPECTKWLLQNIKLNKCGSNIDVFNLDGREFIQNVIKNHLLEEWKSLIEKKEYSKIPTYHVTMNLPAIAVQFLDAFRGLMQENCIQCPQELPVNLLLPYIHVYCFARHVPNIENKLKEMVEDVLQTKLDEVEVVEVWMMGKNKSKKKQNVFVVKNRKVNSKRISKKSTKAKEIKDIEALNNKTKSLQDEVRKAAIEKTCLAEKKFSKHTPANSNDVNIEDTISCFQSL